MKAPRSRIVEELELLTEPSKQLAYEASLVSSAGHAPTELVAGFCDLFNLKDPTLVAAFSADELKDLAHLYGLVVEVGQASHPSVAALLKDPTWRKVVTYAGTLRSNLAHGAQ